jgi:hypothetical protein
MPYEIRKTKGGYKVHSKDTGKAHSDKPLSKSKAKAQMRALYANVKDAGGGRSDYSGGG